MRRFSSATRPIGAGTIALPFPDAAGPCVPDLPGHGSDRNRVILAVRSPFSVPNGTAGIPRSSDIARFLLNALPSVWQHLYRTNDQLLQKFIHLPDRCSRFIFDLDSTVVTAFGKQDG